MVKISLESRDADDVPMQMFNAQGDVNWRDILDFFIKTNPAGAKKFYIDVEFSDEVLPMPPAQNLKPVDPYAPKNGEGKQNLKGFPQKNGVDKEPNPGDYITRVLRDQG